MRYIIIPLLAILYLYCTVHVIAGAIQSGHNETDFFDEVNEWIFGIFVAMSVAVVAAIIAWLSIEYW